MVQANEFDNAIDTFVAQVLGKLDAGGIKETNLEAIWDSLLEDRANQERTLFRKFEALLGKDPNEADKEIVAQLIEDFEIAGKNAMAEIAAAGVDTNAAGTATELSNLARHAGESAVQRRRPARSSAPAGASHSRGGVETWRAGGQTPSPTRTFRYSD